jgi:hypothetical protein
MALAMRTAEELLQLSWAEKLGTDTYTNGRRVCTHDLRAQDADYAYALGYHHGAERACPSDVLARGVFALRRLDVRHVRVTGTPRRAGVAPFEYLWDGGVRPAWSWASPGSKQLRFVLSVPGGLRRAQRHAQRAQA